MEEILEAVILGGGNDNDIEAVILHNILIDRDYVEERREFSLEEMTEENVKLNFRFEKGDIPRLVNAIGIPPEIMTNTRNKVNRTTAMCILLKRLAYPCRLSDLSEFFGLSPQSLSSIINEIVNIIMNRLGRLLDNLENVQFLTREKMEYYAQAVSNRGGAVHNCWGFIDGTARPICKPSVDQENYFSGHKRIHCLKYQSVLCPDGIIISLKGAFEGRKHDARMFRESQLYAELERKASYPDNFKFVLYGDQAYGIMELVLCPYPGRLDELPEHRRQFNLSMKNLRTSVEWGFQKVLSQFAFVDFKKNQKLLQQDLQSFYKVAVLLTNCHTCLYGSQTASYFNVVPPTLEEYLA